MKNKLVFLFFILVLLSKAKAQAFIQGKAINYNVFNYPLLINKDGVYVLVINDKNKKFFVLNNSKWSWKQECLNDNFILKIKKIEENKNEIIFKDETFSNWELAKAEGYPLIKNFPKILGTYEVLEIKTVQSNGSKK